MCENVYPKVIRVHTANPSDVNGSRARSPANDHHTGR
jgi:hypothetical protein